MADEFEDDFDKEFGEIDAMLDADIPGLEDPTEDPDHVSTSVVSNMGSALSRNITIDKVSDSLRNSVVSSLPRGSGEALDKTLDAVDEVTGHLDDSLDKVKKASVNALGGLAEISPEFIANPLKKLRNWLKEETYDSGRELTEDEKIANELTNILGNVKTRDDYKQDDTVKEYMQKQTNELLANIVANTKTNIDLKFDIDNKYYRKDLELKMKQTLTLVNMLSIMKSDSEIRTKQLEAIVKNTALPDFAKNRSSDFVKQMMLNQASDVGLNAFKSTSVFQTATKNVNNLINDKISTFVTGTEQLTSLTDMIQQNREMGINPITTLVDMMVGKGVDKVTKTGSEKLIRTMLENEKGRETLSDFDKLMSDPSRAVKELTEKAQSEDYGSTKSKMLELLSETLGSNMRSQSYAIHNPAEVNQATFMDNKIKTTWVSVIPNLLSDILLEVKAIRTGSKEVDNNEKKVFDFNENRFITRKELKETTDKKLVDKGKSLLSSTKNTKLIKNLIGNNTISSKETILLSEAIAKYLSDGKSPSPYYMLDDGILNYISDSKVRNKLRTGLLKLVRPKDKKDYDKITDVQTQLTNIQMNNISNHKDITDRLANTTDLEMNRDIGLVTDKDRINVSSTNISNINKKYVEKATELSLKELENKTRGFKVGGYSGDSKGKDTSNEIAGVTHKEEYIINKEKLNSLIEDVKQADIESITKTITNITEEVAKKSNKTDKFIDIDKSIRNLSEKVTNIAKEGKTFGRGVFTKKVGKSAHELLKENGAIEFDKLERRVMKSPTEVLETLSDEITSLITDTSTKINTIKETTLEQVTNYIETIPKSWDDINKVYTTSLEMIKDSIPTQLESVKDSLTNTLSGVFNLVPDTLKDTLTTSMTTIGDDITDKYETTVIGGMLAKDELTDKISKFDTNKLTGLFDKKPDVKGMSFSTNGNLGLNKNDDIFKSDIDKLTGKVKNLNTGINSSSLITNLKSLFQKSDSSGNEIDDNMKRINEIITNHGLDTIISKALLDIEFPKTYPEAVHSYRKMFNTIDPTGESWNKLKKEDNFIEKIQKLHIKVIEDRQKGLLGRAGEKLDDGLNSLGKGIGNIRDKFINMLPPNLQPIAKKFLDNKLTQFGGRTIGRVKEAFKTAGKTTLNELRMVGGNVKDAFVDKDGKLHIPNAIDLAKLTGKTYFGTMKALGKGVKELYPELYGIGKDTVKTGGSIAWNALGINKVAKRTTNKVKAFFKPPIDKKLYKAWTSGKMTAGEVMEVLPDEEKATWEEWLKENTRPGLTLPDMLTKTGKWYLESIIGTSKIVKPTYTTVGKATKKVSKTFFKAAWKFSGIPDLFDSKDEPKLKVELRYIDIISDAFKPLAIESINTIGENLSVNPKKIEIINELIPKQKDESAKQLIKLFTDLNKLYIKFNESHDLDLTEAINDKIVSILTYLDSRKETVKVKHKDKVDVKNTTKSKKGFKSGGYTGDIDINEEAGVTHGKEYVINHGKLSSMIQNVKNFNVNKVFDSVKNIVDDVKSKSTFYKDKITSRYNGIRDNVNEKLDYSIQLLKDTIDRFDAKITSSIDKLTITIDKLADNLTEKFSIFDKDKDGDRDGNALDRFKKLYGGGSKETPDVQDVVIRDSKTRCWGGTSCLTKLLLGFGTLLGGIFMFKNKSITNLMDDIGTTIADTYRSIKYLPEAIGLHFRDALSFTHLTDKPTKEEWDIHDAKVKGIDLVKAKKEREEFVNSNIQTWEKIQLRNAEKIQDPKRKQEYLLNIEKQKQEKIKEYYETFNKNKGLDRLDPTTEAGREYDVGDYALAGGAAATAYGLANKASFGMLHKAVKAPFKLAGLGIKKAFGITTKADLNKMSNAEYFEYLKKQNLHPNDIKPSNVADDLNRTVKDTPKPKKQGLFSKAWSAIKSGASKVKNFVVSVYEKNLSSKLKNLLTKIRGILGKVKSKIIKKIGIKAGKKLIAKTLAKFVPGLGTAMLAYDLGKILYLMTFTGLSLASAFTLQMLGVDLFSDDVSDEEALSKLKEKANSKDIKPANNTDYTLKTKPVNNILTKKEQLNVPKIDNKLITSLNSKEDISFYDKAKNKLAGIGNSFNEFMEKKPKEVKDYIKGIFSIGKVNKQGGDAYSPIGGINNITLGKNAKLDGLLPAFKSRILAMANEYNQLTNKKLSINSGYRSFMDQVRLKLRYGSRAAMPGSSTHEYGFAFDTNTSTANELDKLGLMAKYGFTRPIGKETWHIEPALVQLDLENAKKHPDFANRLITMSYGKGGSGWAVNPKAKPNTRNKDYQISLIKEVSGMKEKIVEYSKSKLLEDKKKILSSFKAKVTDTYNGIKDKTNEVLENVKSKTSTKTNKLVTTEKKPNVTTVKVDTKHLNNSKELNTIKDVQLTGNGLLEKSLKVQYGTYKRLGELVEVNKSMLEVLKGNKPKDTRTIANNNKYNLPSYDELVKHDVSNF